MSPKATVRKNGAAFAAPTPSETVVKASNKSVTVVDALGRSITVRKITPLLRMKFAEVVGAEAARNQVYIGTAALAVCVTEIDGEKIAFPSTKRELEAIIQRLDEEGVDAVAKAVAELSGFTVNEDGEVVHVAQDPVPAAKN